MSRSNQLGNTETALVAGAKEDDAIAFEELVELHERKHRRLALRITHSPEDAEDAVQGSLQAFVHLRSFRGDSLFSTWLLWNAKGWTVASVALKT